MNPIAKYKSETHLTNTQIANKIGCSRQFVLSMVNWEKKQFGGMKVETANKIKNKIGVDVAAYIDSDTI